MSRNASSDLDKLLREYKRVIIDFNETSFVESRNIAEQFVNNFIKDLKETTGTQFIKLQKQGSAFENVKVFSPNEFDYLLVFAVPQEKIPSNNAIKKDLSDIREKAAVHEDLSVSYDTIQIPEFMKKYPKYEQFCDEWPGTKEKCVSSHLMCKWYEDGLLKYWEKIVNNPNIQGVKKVNTPRMNDPALTTALLKNDGTEISVDMSVCIRLYGPNDDKFYIAKRPHTIDQHLGHRASLMWLPTHSMEERDAILSKFEHQRDNYKIVKALMYKLELIASNNSYILKAIFLRKDTDKLLPSEKPSDYLNYFMEALQSAYALDMKRRRVQTITDDEKQKHTVQGFMNPRENVLARYPTSVIERKLDELKQLINLRDTNPESFRRRLMMRDIAKLPKKMIDEYKLGI